MTQPTLHMIGNAHLDPVWLWQWQEGFAEAKATFRSALDRIAEYPEFVFTSSSAALYEWIEGNDPPMFAEIKARVAEGRWQIVGGWWIQPDCNLPCGESFVRQGLYGQRYFREKLGVTARVGYNVDSFGHHAMLPQILRKSGMDAYVFMRPAPHEKALPGGVFWWESGDGSRVLAVRVPYEYCTSAAELDAHVRRCAAEIKAPFRDGICFYGVGNHGGGPTRANIESIQRLDGAAELPRLSFSTPDGFVAALLAEPLPIPVVHDDLQHHASGCYAAHSGVKRWNRRAENLLLTAEKWSSIAHWLTGTPYPAALTQAWKAVLFNQFHDILAGTSLEVAYVDARDTYGEACAIAARALNHATQAIAWQIALPHADGTTPIVVFNPHAWRSVAAVELEWGRLLPGSTLLDDAGQPLALQVVQSQAAARGRSRLAFAADLPPLGYRVYRVQAPAGVTGGAPPEPEPTQPRPTAAAPLVASATVLENRWCRLELDAATGYIRSLRDTQLGVELLGAPGAVPAIVDDPSDTWSHDITHFGPPVGAFTAESVRLVEQGPVKAVLRVASRYGTSRLVQDFTLYRDLPGIEVRATLDWNEHWRMLKLQFPLNLHFVRATYEIPYGAIERPTSGAEMPGQSWVDATGIARDTGELVGLSLINDGKYSFDMRGKVLSMTVLRSPLYAHHDPFVPAPDAEYVFTDQGVQHFAYALLPHAGGWEGAGVVQRAAELNQRPTTLVETAHPHGTLPQSAAFVEVDQPSVVVGVLKQAEDGAALIVRCSETAGAQTSATIRLPRWSRTLTAHFGPWEIKTFRVPRDAAQPVVETDLLEWTSDEAPTPRSHPQDDAEHT